MIVSLGQIYLQRLFIINFFRIFNHRINDYPFVVFKPLIKAARPSGMASDITYLFDPDYQCIIITIEKDFLDNLPVSGFFALTPDLLSGSRPIDSTHLFMR